MKKTMIWIICIFVLLVCITSASVENFKMPSNGQTISLNKGWQFREGDSPIDKKGMFKWMYDKSSNWRGFDSPGSPEITDNSTFVWERVKIPKEKYRDPSIYIYTYNQDFQVYMDGKLLYSFGKIDDKNSEKLPGSFWHIIELPYDANGKYIYIRMHGLSNNTLGNIMGAEYGSRADEVMKAIKQNLLNCMISVLFIIIGLSIFLIAIVRYKECRIFVNFGLSCITAGLWLMAEESSKQLFIYNPPFWEYMKIIGQYLIPVTFILLINDLLKYKYKKIFYAIATAHGALLGISLLGDFLNIMPVNNLLTEYYILFGISASIVIFIIIKDYFLLDTDVKVFVFGLIMLCSSGIFDVVNWNFNKNHGEVYVSQWGIIIFLINTSIVVSMHYINAKEEVYSYSQKLKSEEKRLHESRKQLEFFANISHELRTPLNIILSTLQLLSLFINDGSIKISGKNPSNYFEVMKQNCFRLLKLVNNLIDINKIDSGYLKVDLQNRDIVAVVEDITQSSANYIKSKGIDIIFDTDVEEKIIAFDIEKMERIMLNLLSNAVKFTDKGGLIMVEVHDYHETIEICVKDNGVGIEEDKLREIFERFVQVDRLFTRNHEGSGIGLSLVKSFVEMQDGHISVESKHGEGSEFKVSLPVRQIKDKVVVDNVELINVHEEKVNIEFSDIDA